MMEGGNKILTLSFSFFFFISCVYVGLAAYGVVWFGMRFPLPFWVFVDKLFFLLVMPEMR